MRRLRSKASPLLAASAALLLHAGIVGALLAQPEQQAPMAAMQVISVALVEKKAAATPAPEPLPEPKEPTPEPLPIPPEKVAQPLPESDRPTAVPVVEQPAEPNEVPPVQEAVAQTETPLEEPETETQEATEAAVTEPVFEAAYLRNKPPAYPRMARRLRQQGTVELRVRVSADGAAANLAIARSSGVKLLDQAALDTVRHWRFVPALRGKTAVEAWVVVPIQFRLEG